MELDDFQLDNLANWSERVAIHASSNEYGLSRYVDDPSHISDVVAFDAPLVGDIAGLTVAHLQCHIGTDTVSLARLGAEVTGLDFSEPAIDVARGLARSSGTAATFVVANVYDAATELGRAFDLVYTSVGAIGWLADLGRWAAAVAGLLEPGGRLYLRDTHPALWVFDEVDGEVKPVYPYFTEPNDPLTIDETGTYTDGGGKGSIVNARTHCWNHTIADVVNALVAHGMVIDRLKEFEGVDWPFVPSALREGSQWFFPGELRGKLPGMFAVWATRHGNQADVAPPTGFEPVLPA